MADTLDLNAAAQSSECMHKVAYSRAQAAMAVGLSIDMIHKAVRAGDLIELHPLVNGRPIAKGLIPREELERWVRDGLP